MEEELISDKEILKQLKKNRTITLPVICYSCSMRVISIVIDKFRNVDITVKKLGNGFYSIEFNLF